MVSWLWDQCFVFKYNWPALAWCWHSWLYCGEQWGCICHPFVSVDAAVEWLHGFQLPADKWDILSGITWVLCWYFKASPWINVFFCGIGPFIDELNVWMYQMVFVGNLLMEQEKDCLLILELTVQMILCFRLIGVSVLCLRLVVYLLGSGNHRNTLYSAPVS